MDRLYRVSHGGATFLRGRARRRSCAAPVCVGDDIFGGYALGEVIAGGLAVAEDPRAGPSVEVRLRRPELPRSRRGDEEAAAAGAALFFKPSTAVLNPGEPILLPPGVGRVDYEVGAGAWSSAGARTASRRRGRGTTSSASPALNDVTARDIQNKETQYTRAKGFDTFAPFGPCIAVGATGDPRERRRMGERRAASGVHDRAADLPDRLSRRIHHVRDDARAGRHHLHRHARRASAPLKAGDVVTVKVEGVGELDESGQRTSD